MQLKQPHQGQHLYLVHINARKFIQWVINVLFYSHLTIGMSKQHSRGIATCTSNEDKLFVSRPLIVNTRCGISYIGL